jgi:O-antigen ligase
MTSQLHSTAVLRLQTAISVIATAIVTIALVVLLLHYIAAMFQPVRWPTRYYFLGMLLIAMVCKQRTTIMLFVFCLPILPDLHLQLEAVLKPPVKYFVGHPGLDVVAGFCLGLWAKQMWLAKKIKPPFEQVHWALGSLIITLAVSTSIAVSRNLHAAGLVGFNLPELFENLIQFKLINHPNNYLPIVDLLNYSFAILTICVLVPILRSYDTQEREEIIFRPLILSLILSALWGILQAFTGLGLFQVTLDYRPASFGFGAQGFQPDIHAFAALMLIGTVGIVGFLQKAQKRDVWLGCLCIALCWIALILSKSKATFVFAVLASLVLLIVQLKHRGFTPKTILYGSFGMITVFGLLMIITKNVIWLEYLWELLNPDNFSRANFNRALAYRPELFRAALYMFSEYPLFGAGQGNFLRLSSNIDVSQSVYLVQSGGNNVHNYFLQTLAETGLVGILTFALAIGWPFYRADQFSKIAAPALAILSIALGNLFSHPLLVRPNLILLAVVLALMYASVDANAFKSARSSIT